MSATLREQLNKKLYQWNISNSKINTCPYPLTTTQREEIISLVIQVLNSEES